MKKLFYRLVMCITVVLLLGGVSSCGNDGDGDDEITIPHPEDGTFEYKPYQCGEGMWVTSFSVYDNNREKWLGSTRFQYYEGRVNCCNKTYIEYEPGVDDRGYKYIILDVGGLVTDCRYASRYKTIYFRAGDLLGSHSEEYTVMLESGRILSSIVAKKGFYTIYRYFTYKNDNLACIEEQCLSNKNQITFTYTNESNNASLDFNKLIIFQMAGSPWFWDEDIYTSSLTFDLFDFIGKRDANLIKTIQVTDNNPDVHDENHSSKIEVEYVKDAQGRITKINMTKTYLGNQGVESKSFHIIYN